MWIQGIGVGGGGGGGGGVSKVRRHYPVEVKIEADSWPPSL